MKQNHNIIPRNWKTIHGRFLIRTTASDRLDDTYTVNRMDYGPELINNRTGERFQCFLSMIRNHDVFFIESIEREIQAIKGK